VACSNLTIDLILNGFIREAHGDPYELLLRLKDGDRDRIGEVKDGDVERLMRERVDDGGLEANDV
jgi:hypothetical protein